jgi:alkylated DNA repair dioxygenase AlkB
MQLNMELVLEMLNTQGNYSLLAYSDGQQMLDADVLMYPQFFSNEDSDILFNKLLNTINWQQDRVIFNEQNISLPRLTAWYGDPGKVYSYSGITKYPEPWTAELLMIKHHIEKEIEYTFNSVLLNLYRSGKDRVSWHSDDEPELGINPIIASVSFGETRRFQFRHRFDKSMERITVNLTHGSLLVMRGSTQHYWQHQIPEGRKSLQERVNLTFRMIN